MPDLYMPVYRNFKLIHIHIPKTGGTAIGRFFSKNNDMQWNGNSLVGQKKLGNRWYEYQHLTMLEFKSLTKGEFIDFDSLAVTRNPYSRLVSDYCWRCIWGAQHQNANIRAFETFKKFIQAIPRDVDRNWLSYLVNANKKDANFLIHVRPQHHYVRSPSGKQLVNKLMQFERLKDDFDQLAIALELENEIVKTTKERDYLKYFDRETIDIVNSIYIRDFELGSYALIE